MASGQLKLYYFDGYGRAEVSRILLAAAGKQYEDIRFSEEEWPKSYQPQTPFGQVPVLEVDGQKFAQSVAISTYLAREFGFYGKTNLESLKIDQIVQLVAEMWDPIIKIFYTEDPEEQKRGITQFREETSLRFLNHLERLLKESPSGYFVGDTLTLADIVVFDMATGMFTICKYVEITDKYPVLKKHEALVRGHPRIGPYMATRKQDVEF